LLKGGTSQLVSEHYRCNTSRTTIFLKTYGEDTFRCPYKDYSSHDKLTRIYFLHLLSTIYYSVTTSLRPGKKVSILPLGNVNLRPVPSRRNLLEDNPYLIVGVACLSCD
jgi:hypothetical protein